VALGIANIGGAVFSSLPSQAPLSRSAVNAATGAKSQVALLVCGIGPGAFMFIRASALTSSCTDTVRFCKTSTGTDNVTSITQPKFGFKLSCAPRFCVQLQVEVRSCSPADIPAPTPSPQWQSSGIIVGILLYVVRWVLCYLPSAVLSSTVIMAVSSLVDIGTARRLWRQDRGDFWVSSTSLCLRLGIGFPNANSGRDGDIRFT
jgi:hypothetical protein